MEKIEKQSNPKVMNIGEEKLTLKCFGFNESSSGHSNGEISVDRITNV